MSKFYDTADDIEMLRAKLNVMGEYAMFVDSQLAAMTERKDGWRKVAMEWREAFKNDNYGIDKELHECFLRDIRNWSNYRRNERRGSSNG